MVNLKDITTIEVPRYAELSVSKIWIMIKEADDLLQYFLIIQTNKLQIETSCFYTLNFEIQHFAKDYY